MLIYNPDRVKEPPTSFADLLDPKYKGSVGFPDVNAFYVMMAASLYASGTSTDFDKAKELMQKLNANGAASLPSTDAGGPPFKTGEIDVGVMWLARVNMWQNAGIPVKASFPKEGCILYVSGMVVPKNAPNKEGRLRLSQRDAGALRAAGVRGEDGLPADGRQRTAHRQASPSSSRCRTRRRRWWCRTTPSPARSRPRCRIGGRRRRTAPEMAVAARR